MNKFEVSKTELQVTYGLTRRQAVEFHKEYPLATSTGDEFKAQLEVIRAKFSGKSAAKK